MTYKFITMDWGNGKPTKDGVKIKNYEIWLGKYHLGQGYDPPHKPEKVGEIEATSFKVACYIFELERTLSTLKGQVQRLSDHIEDAHFGISYYNPKTNSNGWTGKYYETEEQALESFK